MSDKLDDDPKYAARETVRKAKEQYPRKDYEVYRKEVVEEFERQG